MSKKEVFMNVFIYEMKQYKKSIIIWSIALAVLTAIFMQFLPMFLEESEAMLLFFEGLGEEVTSALGLNINTFFSEVGFYSYLFTYLSLMAAIQALNVGLSIISKENKMKTADFLMTKPKSRTSIYISKFFAGFCSLLITEIFFYLAAYISISIVKSEHFSLTAFTLISFTFSIIQFIFFTLGLFVATLISKIKAVIPLTMGIVFSFFLLGMISGITGSDVLVYFTPFKYFNNNFIMLNNAYETKFLVISIVLPIVFTILSYINYTRKDIPSV